MCPLPGATFRLGGCASSGHALCIAGLPAELQGTVSPILSSLNRIVDALGKETARSAEVLFMFEHTDGANHVHRVFAILLLARYSPKSQVWALCDLDPSADHTALTLPMPFEVVLSARPSKVSHTGIVVNCCTSAELAATLAATGRDWFIQQLVYSIPDRETLVVSVVSGNIGERRCLSGAGAELASRRAARPPTDPLIQALRRRARRVPKGNEARSSGGQRRARQLADDAASAPDGLPPVGDGAGESNDEAVADGDLDDFPPDLIAEIAELMEADQQAVATSPSVAQPPDDIAADPPAARHGSGAGSSMHPPSNGVGVDAPLGAEAPPRAEAAKSVPSASGPGDVVQGDDAAARASEICGPSPTGYITENGRLLGRITAAFSGSGGVRCYLHPRCSIAIKENRMPDIGQVIAWLLGAERVQPTDSPQEKEAKRSRHMQALRDIRDRKP